MRPIRRWMRVKLTQAALGLNISLVKRVNCSQSGPGAFFKEIFNKFQKRDQYKLMFVIEHWTFKMLKGQKRNFKFTFGLDEILYSLEFFLNNRLLSKRLYRLFKKFKSNGSLIVTRRFSKKKNKKLSFISTVNE